MKNIIIYILLAISLCFGPNVSGSQDQKTDENDQDKLDKDKIYKAVRDKLRHWRMR